MNRILRQYFIYIPQQISSISRHFEAFQKSLLFESLQHTQVSISQIKTMQLPS